MGARLAAAAAATAILVAAAASYLPFVSDDALISLRYADRLLDGRGLTWNDGERVEGYSNLSWVLVNAGLGAVGLDLIVAARIAGFAGFLAAILALFRAFPRGGLRGTLPAAAGALALTLSAPVAVWTVGGLEQPLLAGLLAWAVATSLPLIEPGGGTRGWIAPGLLLAAMCWTRPDAPLFTVGVCAGLLAARGIDRHSLGLALRLAALPAVAYTAQTGFRLAYYGEWVSNSALAKLAFSPARLVEGLGYVGGGLLWSAPLVLAALGLAVLPGAGVAHRRRVRLFVVPLVLWLAYVAVIGGDIFPARRHLIPALVVLAFLLSSGLKDRLDGASARTLAAAMGVVLAATALLHALDPEARRARRERWEWDGAAAGRLLREAFPPDTLIAVDPAGTLPYFSELPAVDMLGLNDRFLAHNPPEGFGRGPLAHELGNGRYVLDRKPDLVLFCSPEGGARPCFRSGREMVREPEFTEGYRLTTLAATEPHAFTFQPWVRLDSPRTGVLRDGDRIVVPAHLLMATGRSVARLDDEGLLVVDVEPGRPAGFAGLRLAPGHWRFVTEPAGDLRLTVGARHATGNARGFGSGNRGARLRIDEAVPQAIHILIESQAGRVAVRAVIVERLAEG